MFRIVSATVLRLFFVLRRIGKFRFYQPVPQLGVSVDRGRHERTFRRWEAIEAALPAGPLSVLDIGCNAGFFSIQMAERGNFVTAIDHRPYAFFVFFAREYLQLPTLSSAWCIVTPKNVQALPSYDCIFLLSVFHHWCYAYGADSALGMLDTIVEKTDKMLFFETGQTDTAKKKYRDTLPDMEADPEKWLHDYFMQKQGITARTISHASGGRYLLAVSRDER